MLPRIATLLPKCFHNQINQRFMFGTLQHGTLQSWESIDKFWIILNKYPHVRFTNIRHVFQLPNNYQTCMWPDQGQTGEKWRKKLNIRNLIRQQSRACGCGSKKVSHSHKKEILRNMLMWCLGRPTSTETCTLKRNGLAQICQLKS